MDVYEATKHEQLPELSRVMDRRALSCATQKARDQVHRRNLMLNHGSTSEPFIQSDNMKWRFAGQCAPAILDCVAQADIVRALTLCRIMRRGDDVRQTEKRLIDAELSMAYRLNPSGIDAGSEARVPH